MNQSRSRVYVRFGSKADIGLAAADVRFTPKSGHCRARLGCPLGAKSGLMRRSEVGRYSITSSARANNVAGIVTPTALDVF
jgi:hypothetical protein